MPNQNYIEAREELKMAQCDLSLSYPTCKTEERYCKFAYSSWCPTCDKESPRRRSKSETNEPCRRKGKEMKGLPRRFDWNQECENMELDYETKDIRYDTYRIRSNLCELPTTYITNNCQMMKLSSCPTDIVDITEKSFKCYENNLKSYDLNTNQNSGSMVDSDRISKLFPRIEQSVKAINSIANKINPKLDTTIKPRINTSHPTYLELKPFVKPQNEKKLKPINGTNLGPKTNEPLEIRNGIHNNHLKLAPPKLLFPPTHPVSCKKSDKQINSSVYYDTSTFFTKKIDVNNLKQRYAHEVELLKEKLIDIKNPNYESHPKVSSAPARKNSLSVLPPMPENCKRESSGAIPKVLAAPPPPPPPPKESNELSSTSSLQNKRLKSTSKVSLKTKGKLSVTKLRKKSKACTSIVLSNSDGSDSEYSGDEDSEKDLSYNDSESLEKLSSTSSLRTVPSANLSKFAQYGAGDALDWPIRQSLFAHIPPYLKFVAFDATNPQKLPYGTRYLKWKMSTITPILIRKTLTNSGFRLVRKSNEWMGTWGKHMKSPMFKTLKETQKLNHFPGTFQIGRKDRLWRNLQKLMIKHGQREFGFIPQTYVLPQDLKLLKQHWQNKNGDGGEKYIIKPPASARGTGIKVINRWSQLPKRMSLVVQEYISNPYLINGSKFDLRLYVLVTSFDPLRIYLYPDGLVRFASVPYSDDAKDLKDRFMHLTNYSINKMSSMYTANEDANSCKGHKWTLSKLWEYMENKGVDTKALWKNLKQLVIKTMISGESPIVALCRENVNSRYNCYELFGVDVLLDDHLKSWLLEVNISPSLHSQSPLDEFVKGPMVKCLFELAQFHLPPRLSRMDHGAPPQCFDSRIYSTTLTKKERNKQIFFAQAEDREDYVEDILYNLTGDDIRHLTQAEDELMVMGQFQRIFPTSNSHKYFHFMETRYYNRLFDAWETRYERNRKPGIEILQSLCNQRLHLKVAPPTVVEKNLPNSNPGEPSAPQPTDSHPQPAVITQVQPTTTGDEQKTSTGLNTSK